MTRNILVNLEGLDGSGKTVVAKALVDKLISAGKDVLALREPGGTDIGYEIRRVLLEFKNTNMTARTEVLLFNAARAQLLEEKIEPFLSEGTNKIVLLDRFYDSTLAYQGAGRGEDIGDLMRIIDYAVKGRVPDLTLLLALSPEQALSRKGEAQNRLDKEDITFYQRIDEHYRIMASTRSRWSYVDATLPIESVIDTCFVRIMEKAMSQKEF